MPPFTSKQAITPCISSIVFNCVRLIENRSWSWNRSAPEKVKFHSRDNRSRFAQVTRSSDETCSLGDILELSLPRRHLFLADVTDR